jgi:hypothetical protein
MANLIEHLTSIAPDMRSGPSPGRRLLATTLCAMLALGSVFPGFALAGEADSEGEGTVPPVEVPAPPDFDPGGEEIGLEETPASGGEESGAVETEPEADIAAPSPEEVTSAAAEAAPPPPVAVPEPASAAPEPARQQASEPIANQSIVAPKQKPIERHPAEPAASSEAAPPAELAEQEAPPPQPVAVTPADSGRNLAGKDSYVVRPGDCLWHIAADLLPVNADTEMIEDEVVRLWRLNEDRIGTGDPNLIYAGTELRLR